MAMHHQLAKMLTLAPEHSLPTRRKHIDNNITDSLNEAKDNVKYLATLDKYTEPLYNGKPQEIIDSLPVRLFSVAQGYPVPSGREGRAQARV